MTIVQALSLITSAHHRCLQYHAAATIPFGIGPLFIQW